MVSLQQTNPSSPGFNRKISKELLWIDGWYNPGWANEMLAGNATGQAQGRGSAADCGSEADCGKSSYTSGVLVNVSKVQERRENNGLETLSVEEALTSVERMPQLPSVQNLTCILQKCRRKKNVTFAKRLYAYMCRRGLEDHRSLGNYLVPMLVQVGSMWDAQQAFNSLVDRNEHSWTSLIKGYLECGELQIALNIYRKMQRDSVHPSKYTFVALLKACAQRKNAKRGQEIHTEIVRRGLEGDLVVGNTLVDIYSKCGLIAKAWEVFEKLPVRDVVSWTALIAGFAEHGLGEEALDCFEQMRLEGLSPDAVAFICSLKACGSIGAIDKGQQIHAEIAKQGLEKALVVGNTLVDMYAKCGLLAKAREAFEKLPVRDIVSWNTLITGYAEQGIGEEALTCFEEMQLVHLSPDAVTYVCSLKACGSIGAIEKGRGIHAEIARMGLERDLFVGNTLVDMYAKCGFVGNAQEAFDKLPVRDSFSWNALITGYAELGLVEEVMDCYEQMQLEGVAPDAVTFLCSLKACGGMGAIDEGQQIHEEIARKGLERDLVVGSALVDVYAKCSLLANAQEAFDFLPVRNKVSWTALIVGYAEHGLGEEALNCFEQMQLEGLPPDAITFVCSLKACGSIGAVDKGREIHAEIVRKGLERELFVGSILVNMYAKYGFIANAREVFKRLPVRNEVSWTALIAGYAEHGLGEEAMDCLEEMQLEGISADAVTFVCGLKACGSLGAIDKGREIHTEIARKGLESDLGVGNTLVDLYVKCGLLAKAQEAFEELPVRDVVSWNTLIAGYAQLGESEIAFYMLGRMNVQGWKPDGVTFSILLTVCSHTGLVDTGQKYFEAMSKDYGITATIDHYTVMVDLLGRAGQLDEAIMMVKKMPFYPDLMVWHTVLGSCRKWGNVELAKLAFEHAVQLDEKNAAAYVLMSNIYADAHMQEDEK